MVVECGTFGCTDPLACNFNAGAACFDPATCVASGCNTEQPGDTDGNFEVNTADFLWFLMHFGAVGDCE
jgi:hypothetical protein